MDNDVKARKAELRKELLKIRSAINEVEAYKKSRKICESIINTKEFKDAAYIFAYMPTKNEVSILPVVEAALALGKRVAFPRCLDKNGRMAFFEITSYDDFVSGAFNIKEPKPECPQLDIIGESITGIMLVPGVGFDEGKNRLGYGGGYYDRYIGAEKSVCYIAPAYEMQVVESIPTEPHDRPVDMIVTEKMVR